MDEYSHLVIAWNTLVLQATAETLGEAKITYSNFLREVYQAGPDDPVAAQGAGRYLHPIQDICCFSSYPPLTGLVVSQATGLPSTGFAGTGIYDYEEAMQMVLQFDWKGISNPFLNDAGETINEEQVKNDLIQNPEGSSVFAQISSRGNRQRIFRKALLDIYNNTCAICDINLSELLEAAHIKDWAVCNEVEATSIRNGILLCRNHHKAFDVGFWTLSDELDIMLREAQPIGQFANTIQDFTPPIPPNLGPRADFLSWHRGHLNW